MIPALAASLFALTAPASIHAAIIQEGDVTSILGPTFFVDDAALGGSDTDIGHGSTASFIRLFNGLLTPNQGLTRVVLSGFGFATHQTGPPVSTTVNSADTIAVTFTYLGADGATGGGDDVPIGTATGSFTFSGGKEYVFAFDTPLAADLTITGTRFRIQVAPTNADHIPPGPDTALKLKTGALASEPAVTSAKLSVAGAATPFPLINPQRLNLAKFQPVTATSTDGQRLAAYLTDGVVGNDNRWQGSNSAWQSAVIDFPFPVEVGSAQVFTGVDDANPIASYGVQFWNGSAWTAIDGGSVSGNTNIERNLVFTNPVTASSFRFISSEANLRVKELAIYPPNGPSGFPLGTDLTLNLAYQRPTVASANTAGNFALKATDGRASAGSMWQTTTAGTNTLDIDLRVSTKIGSAHLYSGSTGVSPLLDFVLKYWNGTAWQNIPGGTVAGNATSDRVVSFTPVTTSQVRLEFTNTGTTSIRELCIFPANTGNVGYPIGTNLINSAAVADYETYNDAFYLITNPTSTRRISVPSNGQPALDPAGLTFGQSQYQVLLNLSNGTYRLRNRASGNCLSGAQLDKTPGLLLTDIPYSALPHQDWNLDPLGGGNFQFINQWSGLVIDSQGGATAPGTPLVQNTATGSLTQRWKISKFAGFPKKGIGGTTFAMAFNPSWAYNWGRANLNPFPEDASFYPMQWGNFSWDIVETQMPLRQDYSNWRKRSDGMHLLGFNEPDAHSQSGDSLDTQNTNKDDFSITRSVNEAVRLWPRMQELDQPLLSPAPASKDNGWLASFYTQADALGYRVNGTGVHTYPSPSGGSADNLIEFVNSAYTTWQRPVWLTEFSFVDWNKNQSWSEEDNYNCLAEFLWRAENNNNLRKYALFVFRETTEWPQPTNAWTAVSPAPRSNSYDINGNLTAFGKLYAAWDNDTTVRTDKIYHIHHKQSRKRIANLTSQNNLAGRNIRVDGALVNWTLVSAGASRYYVVSSLDGRRISRQDANGTANPNGTAVALVSPVTTGTAVEWILAPTQHGWYHIENPNATTAKRLKLVYSNSSFVATYSMVDDTNTGDDVQWRFIVAPPQSVWSGATDNSWTTASNWAPNGVPSTGAPVIFDGTSTANVNTMLNQDFNVLGIKVTNSNPNSVPNPSSTVTIGGTHTLTIGAYGIAHELATRDLTVNTSVVLGAIQGWSVANNRTLNLGGVVSGNHDLTIGGAGRVLLSASNVLPNGTGSSNLIVNGTLNLNGTSQAMNGLSGTGLIDNTAVGTASLTLGNNNAASTLTTLQDTGGALSLIKIGSGSLTVPNASTYSGGFTNNGTGSIVPQNNSAFGTGPVVMNGATLIGSAADYTIGNPLTLNGAILRVGGQNNRTLTWAGPVTATGTSSINADGGSPTTTNGVILSGGLEISGGTFSSVCSGVANTISGPISGTTGTLRVSSGTLNLNAANTFSGSIRPAAGTLIIGNALAMQNATLDMNASDSGSVNLSNLSATLGAITGSRDLNLGIGTISIGNNATNTTYSGVLSGNGSLAKTGNGTLTLSAVNSYAGSTTVNGGTLALGRNSALPATAVIISNGTLDAATFTDTVGTLDVTSTAAKINLGPGGKLVFANSGISSGIDWSGGSLSITGNFVPGVSLRFGNNSSGLTSTQLALISAPGFTSFALTPTGFLTATVAGGYDSWKTQITNGLDGRTDDADGDGFTNLHEFLFGTSPIAGNGSLVNSTAAGGNLVLRWLQRESAATYTLKQSTTLHADSWTTVVSPVPALDADQTGSPTDYDRYTVTLPTGSGGLFFRIEGKEN